MKVRATLVFVALSPGLTLACDSARATPPKAASHAVASSNTPTQRGDAAGQLEDLAAFERDFFNVDRSYSPEARVEASKQIESLRKGAGAISDTLFVLRLSQVAALADNGHTSFFRFGSGDDTTGVGIRMTTLGEDFVVVQAMPEHAGVLGGRLVAIDETPLTRLREVARTLTGGIPSRRDQRAPEFFENLAQMKALELAKSSKEATYRFQMPDGTIRDERLMSVERGVRGGASAFLDPGSAPEGWGTLLPPDKAPWSLQQSEAPMRFRDLPEAAATVIDLRTNMDAGRSIAAFLDEAEAARRKTGRKNVILDMRLNGGGNLQLTRKWMSELPSRLPADGRVVVLTSPWTFSAAISSIGYLKQAGGARVVLVGEAPGDRMRFWAEGQPIFLPHSGALVLMATQRHDYLTGCKGFDDCHGYVATHPIALPNLDPDVAAPWTLDAYTAGRDPGMEAAMRILSKSR